MSELQEFEISPSRCHGQIEDALTTEDVLAVISDYIASLTPQQLASLPEKCRPTRLKGEDDVDYWAFVLAQHRCRPAGSSGEFLQEVLNHFLHALVRVGEIRRERERGEAPPTVEHPALVWALPENNS